MPAVSKTDAIDMDVYWCCNNCLAYVHDIGTVIHCCGCELCQKQWSIGFYSAADSGCLDNVLIVDLVLCHVCGYDYAKCCNKSSAQSPSDKDVVFWKIFLQSCDDFAHTERSTRNLIQWLLFLFCYGRYDSTC